MDSEEETMEMVGPYDEDEDMEELEEEGQDQEVPQVPSPPEESGEVVYVNRLEEVIGNRLETEVEMVNILEEREEDGNLDDEAESSVSETIQSDEADPITVANFNDTTDLLEEEAVAIVETSQDVIPVSVSTEDVDDTSEEVVEEVEANSPQRQSVMEEVSEDDSEDTTTNETEVKSVEIEDKESEEEVNENQADESREAETIVEENPVSVTEPEPVTEETKQSVTESHPGVFEVSKTTSESASRSKDILDSLPVLEKLRAISRSSSIRDDVSVSGAQSDQGDTVSEKDLASTVGPSTRSLRKKEARKPVAAPKRTSQTSSKGRSGGSSGKVTRSSRGKGTGRRTLAKKKPVKAPSTAPTIITSNKIYFEGQYFQLGDIVSVTDVHDNDIYYAQLRGFLTDEYAEKSCVITWLLPTTDSPPPNEGFHPATYILGPEEDRPRKMEVFTFVMHAPSDYFYNRRAPYRTITPSSNTDYTSMRLGPRLRKTVDNKSIYVGIY